MTFRNCVAVDLGASSGRVMLARYERECRSLTLREIHRFNNGLHSQNGYVTWDVDSLESAIRLGLNKVCEEGIRIDSIGIDTWGVDFVLLDQQGQRVGLPVAYRDSRTNGLMAQAQQQLGKRDIYQRSSTHCSRSADAGLLQLSPDRQDELGIYQRHDHATGQYQ